MTDSDPPGGMFAHVPDNVRAEIARRRRRPGGMSGEILAAQVPMSYATLKRRLADPRKLTLGDVEAFARILRVPVERLMRPVNGDVEVRP